MNQIPQQLLICGTVLFLLSLLIGFAVPALPNPRMGVEVHVTGLQSGMALWALGLMWQRLALPGWRAAGCAGPGGAGPVCHFCQPAARRVVGNQPRHAHRRRRPSGQPPA